MTGSTTSSDFPTTAGAYQNVIGGDSDVFVTKLDASGSALVYSTFIGGSGSDTAASIAVDTSGNAYIAGQNRAGNYPTTAGAFQPTFPGNPMAFASELKAIVTKLEWTGATLVYSTYLGGGGRDYARDIAVDASDCAYVTGEAGSTDFPVTAGAFQTSGANNAFVTKFAAAGDALVYSTYLGGGGDKGNGIAVDSTGSAYVTGTTTSPNFPTTPGAYQTAYAGGAVSINSFVTKLDAVGSALVYSTYLGSDIYTSAYDIAVDPFGNALICGFDLSNHFPQTAGAIVTPPGSTSFVSKFDPVGSNLLYSTRFGVGTDGTFGIALDSVGAAYVVGYTSAADFPTTPGAFQANNGGGYDAFVARIDPIPPPATDMRVFASADQTFVPSGGQVTFSFTAYNNGGYPAADVTISSQLPAGVTFNSVVDDGGSVCTGTPGGSSFSCTFPSVNPSEGKTAAISLIATGTAYQVIEVPYSVASSTPESYPADNSASSLFFIASPPLPSPTPGPVDEAELAYTKYDPNASQGDIFRRRADAAGLLNLTNNPASYDDFAWSPDGSRIAFLRDQSGNDANLYVMNADGTNQVRLTNDSSERDFGIAWSPNGTRLAFIASRPGDNTTGVHTINVDGSNLSILTTTTENDSMVAWSPDGARLSFTRSAFDFQAGTFAQSIHVMNADGSNQITFDNSGGEIDYNPAWSPDSAQIAFVRSPNDVVHGPNLFLAQRDGTNLRNLTNDYSVSYDGPRWSPDGSKLAFLSSLNNAGNRVSVINADGTGRTEISGSVTSIYSNRGWSPNGAQLVFTVSYGETYNGLYLVNADGTGLTHIGEDIEHNDNPAWSPDSSKLAFTSARNGHGSIDIVNADGTNRVDLTNAPASYGPPKWRPVPQVNTPAGTNVTITVNGVTLTFSNVTQAGQTTVTSIDPNSLSGVPGEYVINANSLAFEIHTTAIYTGPITIGFQVPGVNNPITFSTLRVLHGEPPPVPNFIDRTVLAPDTPSPNFATRTIYARVTSLSPFLIAEKQPNLMTALGPAQVWVGLKNSDDVGTKFDLLAEVFKNGTLIGSGQINNVVGGSSGFNNAKLNAINLALSGTPAFGPGTTLSFRLSVRVAASSGHRSGTARLWFNDTAANSRFSATIGGVTSSYYLRKPSTSLILATSTSGTTKITIDVLVDRAVGGNPFKPFGTWAITF